VLGSCYRVIRTSYSSMSQDDAHHGLEKEVSRFGTVLNMTLYIDGDPAMGKGRDSNRAPKTTREST
jgi:hypothetical protein